MGEQAIGKSIHRHVKGFDGWIVLPYLIKKSLAARKALKAGSQPTE